MILSLTVNSNAPRELQKIETHLVRVGDEADKVKSKFTTINFNSSSINSFGASLNRVGGYIKNFGMSQLASGFTTLLSSISRFTVSAVGSFLTVNSNLEQMQIMMTTATGSIEGGNKALEDMLKLSTKAPFSIDALSDSFVKLKVSGIDPMDGSLTTLIDSLAAFGGSSEQLKLITVAIQQMVGKGVVSMEELRRQFGEQVPTAIRAMSEGLGISMGEMFDRMKKGQLEAMEGINAMLGKLKEWHGGAAEKRMESFAGAITLVRVEWTKLMRYIGDSNSLFGKITKSVGTVSDALHNLYNTDEGQKKLQALSENFADFFDKLVKDPTVINEFFKSIASAAEYASRPVKLVFGMMMQLQAIVDQTNGSINRMSLGLAGVDGAFSLGNENIIKYRNEFLEITKMQKDLEKITSEKYEFLVSFKGDATEGKEILSVFDKNEAEVRDRIDKLVYEVNDKISGGVAPLTIEVDKVKVKHTAEEMKNEAEKIRKSLNTSLENVNESFTSSVISSAESMVAEYGKASNKIADIIIGLGNAIDEQKDKLRDMQSDFSDDLRDTARDGMSKESAWRDQIKQIEEYKEKAASAFKSNNLKEYTEYLRKALQLTKALSTSGIEEPFDEKKLKKAREEFDKINRITRGNKVAGGEKMYTEAFDKLNKLLKEQKEGTSVAVTAQEQLNVKIKLQKELQESLEKSQRDKIKYLEDEMSKYEDVQKSVDKLSGMMEVYKSSIENGTIAVSELEGEWSTSTASILNNIASITSAIEDMISKAKEFELKSNKKIDVDGARAKGGDVIAGNDYIVGEEGIEVFRAPTNGTIIPNKDLNKSSNSDSVDINISVGKSEKVTVRGNAMTAQRLKYLFQEAERYAS